MSDSQQKDRRRIEAFKKDLAVDPNSLVFVSLAEAHNRLAEWEEAAKVAQRGLEGHPDSVAGRLALAVAEAGRANVKAALEQIKAALLIDDQNPRALALMGSLLLQKGLSTRALDFLAQAVKLAPDSREYGDLLRRAKRLAKSESPVQLPVVKGDNIADVDHPWADSDAAESLPRAAEHTVLRPRCGPQAADGQAPLGTCRKGGPIDLPSRLNSPGGPLIFHHRAAFRAGDRRRAWKTPTTTTPPTTCGT